MKHMKEYSQSRREELVCYLLVQLKDTCLQLQELANEMEGSTDDFLEKVVQETQEEIMALVEEYNGNIRQVELITQQMTERMNEWYAFAKDEKKMASILFPLLFMLEKKRVKSFIRQSRDTISERVIQNRFARDKLNAMEDKLRCKAVLSIESNERYEAYTELTSRKKELLEHLFYLMPTISNLCPLEFSLEDIDGLVTRLSPS